jgi:mRNA interferase RelE/StbE
MRYAITIKSSAQRTLSRLPNDAAERIARAIDGLGFDPRPSGCQKLQGAENLWRIRVGDYRVVYSIEDERLMVLVVRIGHRREIYRG